MKTGCPRIGVRGRLIRSDMTITRQVSCVIPAKAGIQDVRLSMQMKTAQFRLEYLIQAPVVLRVVKFLHIHQIQLFQGLL